MALSAFDQTNFRSKKIRLFFLLLAFLSAGYAAGFGIYLTRTIPESSMAKEMFQYSLGFFTAAVLLVLFLLTLRWQILRTAILALSLLSLAFLYCSVFLLLSDNRFAHAVGLLLLGALFVILFVTQSNLLIYWRDKSYGDVCAEGLLGLGFVTFIGFMIARALGGV
jgi:hypothetical protein